MSKNKEKTKNDCKNQHNVLRRAFWDVPVFSGNVTLSQTAALGRIISLKGIEKKKILVYNIVAIGKSLTTATYRA